MVAKYQIRFFSSMACISQQTSAFPRKARFWLRLRFWYFHNCPINSPNNSDRAHIQITPRYEAHPLASVPRHVDFFYLTNQVLFI